MDRILNGLLATAVLAMTALPATAASGEASKAEIAALRVRLLSHDSATAALQEICDRRRTATIKARRMDAPSDRPTPGWVRQALRAGRADPIQHRRVQLMCGDEVLSFADNWYLPGHLTPGMNTTLSTTETPFGVAVRAMGFRRRTLVAREVEPGEGQRSGCGSACGADGTFVLRHRAVLVDARGRPFSVVEEFYTAAAARP